MGSGGPLGRYGGERQTSLRIAYGKSPDDRFYARRQDVTKAIVPRAEPALSPGVAGKNPSTACGATTSACAWNVEF